MHAFSLGTILCSETCQSAIFQAFFLSTLRKTQVLAIFGETQHIFCKTQVKSSQKSSDLLKKDLQKLRLKIQKLRFPAFHKLPLAKKVDKKKAWLTT